MLKRSNLLLLGFLVWETTRKRTQTFFIATETFFDGSFDESWAKLAGRDAGEENRKKITPTSTKTTAPTTGNHCSIWIQVTPNKRCLTQTHQEKDPSCRAPEINLQKQVTQKIYEAKPSTVISISGNQEKDPNNRPNIDKRQTGRRCRTVCGRSADSGRINGSARVGRGGRRIGRGRIQIRARENVGRVQSVFACPEMREIKKNGSSYVVHVELTQTSE